MWVPRTRRVRSAITDYLGAEALGGIVLALATVVALIWANSPIAETYEIIWRAPLNLPLLHLDARGWVNDGLMAIFFFVAGLEIKRELVSGELRDPKAASVPVLAAIGGMAVPAIVYLSIAGFDSRGWGIPMATDIAFAVGVLSILGRRLPSGLKVFLLTLAIVDDIGAIVVIALFYSSGVSGPWLAASAAGLLFIALAWRTGFGYWWIITPLAVLTWFFVHESGIHATIDGVAIGLLTPVQAGRTKVLEKIEHRIHPFSSFGIIPLFALANAGIFLGGGALARATTSPVFWGTGAGLVVGKIVGISTITLLAVKVGLGRLPEGVRSIHIVGAAALAGIGFTVSLFISELAFSGDRAEVAAKMAILFASLAAAVIGSTILLLARNPQIESASTSTST